MHDDLFFIPIIAEAMSHSDKKDALKGAFFRIEEMGRQPRYTQGLKQFRLFMEIAGDACTIAFVIERNSEHFGEIVISPASVSNTIGGITPGRYAIKMSTGRVIWDGLITESDVIWEKAFKGEPLPLAAATGEARRSFSRREILLDGEVLMFVFPGVESGELGLELSRGE